MDELARVDQWDAIESLGGPLILMPQASLSAWDGTRRPRPGRIVEAMFRYGNPDDPATDYDRACDVADFLGTLSVGDDLALVLGDQPSSTIIIPAKSGTSLVLAKCICGPDDAGVVASLRDIRLEDFPETEVTLTFRSSPQILFDSAFPGDGITASLHADLPSGSYVASTTHFRPNDEIWLTLHWIRPRVTSRDSVD